MAFLLQKRKNTSEKEIKLGLEIVKWKSPPVKNNELFFFLYVQKKMV